MSHSTTSYDRLQMAALIVDGAALLAKEADFRAALGGAEKALRRVQEVRQKTTMDFAKRLQQQNDALRKEVMNASTAAQSAADAARKVQVGSEAQALQMQMPGDNPPAAQPPFGAMAMSTAAQGTDGSEPKLNQALKQPSNAIPPPASI